MGQCFITMTEKGSPVGFCIHACLRERYGRHVFGTNENIPRAEMVCRAAKKVRDEVTRHRAAAPRHLQRVQRNVTSMSRGLPTRLFMGPWLADTMRRCDGLTNMMSYWTFSDVFEEQGVVKTAFLWRIRVGCRGGHSKTGLQRFQDIAWARYRALRRGVGACFGHAPGGRLFCYRPLELRPSGWKRCAHYDVIAIAPRCGALGASAASRCRQRRCERRLPQSWAHRLIPRRCSSSSY